MTLVYGHDIALSVAEVVGVGGIRGGGIDQSFDHPILVGAVAEGGFLIDAT